MPQTITPGSQSATQTITTADTYTLASGATRTQTASTAIQATVASGTTIIDIEGVLTDTASGQRAIRAALADGQILVGANGIVSALNGDAIQAQAFTGANAAVVSTVNLTNLGQILSASSVTAIGTAGAAPPSATYALNYNAAVGVANAPTSDFTSGGVITNGSTSNASALIRSDSGDAIRLGAHQTLVNYGTIAGNGPVNDSSSNNSFNATGDTSVATRYDISRGVRINAASATNDTIDNHGLIQGAQHGVDVGNTAATNIQVVNQAGATILGHNGSGVGADTTGAAAGTVVVTNSGTIRGEYAPTYDRAGYATIDGDGDGVDVDGGATVYNLAGGLIAGSGAGGVLNGQGAGGFDSNGRANRSEGLSLGGGIVVNDGTISGADTAIVVNNDSNATGNRSGVLATNIVNGVTGTIIGQAGYAIRLENKTGTAAIDDDTIVNAGTITGNGNIPTGTVLRQDGNADPSTVGTLNGVVYTAADAGSARFIQGDGAAIQTGEGADTLSNYGTVTGNTGRAISLEGGDDTLNLYTGETITGRIDGGAGSDTLNLRLDARTGATNLGANSGATTGTLAAVVGFEALNVQSGTWTVADAQGYASGIAIASGAGLIVGASGSITGAVANAGTLTFIHSGDLVQADAISGAGSVVQAGSGALVLSAASTYTGGTTLVSGILDLAAATTGTFGAITSAAAGTGPISFTDGGAQILRVESVALGPDAGHTLAYTLTGFGTDGDVIDVRGIGTSSVATFDYANNTLTLGDLNGTHATIHLTGSYAGDVFTASSDNAGGTQVTIAAGAAASISAALVNDTGASNTDHVTSDPTIAGTTNAGALVIFSEGGTTLGTITADASGHYSFDFRGPNGAALLADGTHMIGVTESYLGQTATAPDVALTMDTTAPTLAVGSVSGATNVVDGHVVSGTIDTADAALAVTVRNGTTVLGTAAVDAQGHFTFALPTDMADGPIHTYALTATATDAAGNLGASDSFAFALDYTPNQVLFGTISHDVQSVGGQVFALYEGLLERAPDAIGAEAFAAQLKAGVSLHDVTQAFLNSAEAQTHLNAADNAGYVEQLYETVLGRQGDAPGAQGWIGQLDAGVSRADVADSFVFSSENVAQFQSSLNAGVFAADTAASSVAHLYYGLLDRAPDAGGLQGFTDLLHNGVSLTSVAQNVLSSSEYAQLHQGAQTDQQYVDSLYTHALGRTADANGEQGWLNALSHGLSRADVAIGIVESSEAYQHNAAQIEAGWHLA